MSILLECEQAKNAWKKQFQHVREMADGFVSIKIGDTELMPADLYVELSGFWRSVMKMVEEFLFYGKGIQILADQPFAVSLTRKKDIAIFDINGDKYPVSPKKFLLGLVSGAEDFYLWASRYIGGFLDEDVNKPKILHDIILSGK